MKMIQLHASAGSSKKAEELFRAMRASGVLPTATIYDALLLAYCRAGCLDQAFSVFREYKLVGQGAFSSRSALKQDLSYPIFLLSFEHSKRRNCNDVCMLLCMLGVGIETVSGGLQLSHRRERKVWAARGESGSVR